MSDANAAYPALIICSAVSLLLIGLSVPMVLGKVRRNNWYGLRTADTLKDDAIWYPANRVAGINFISASIIILLAAIVLLILKNWLSDSIVVLLMTAITLVSIIAAVTRSFMFLNDITSKYKK